MRSDDKTLHVIAAIGILCGLIVIGTVVLMALGKPVPSWFETVVVVNVGAITGILAKPGGK